MAQPPQPLALEAFNDQAARAKSVFNPVFLLVIAAYPLTIGFTTAVRSGRMSVVSGRPPVFAGSPPPPGAHHSSPSPPSPSGPDLWVTTDGHSIAMTVLSFFAVFVTHFVLLGHILMKKPVGAPEMKKSYASAAPIVMFFISMTYYINYLGLARYGASTIEWVIFTSFSAATILLSIVLHMAPPKQINMVTVAAAEA